MSCSARRHRRGQIRHPPPAENAERAEREAGNHLAQRRHDAQQAHPAPDYLPFRLGLPAQDDEPRKTMAEHPSRYVTEGAARDQQHDITRRYVAVQD
jgi:hypothetical protein